MLLKIVQAAALGGLLGYALTSPGARAQTPATSTDSFAALRFLEGTWSAHATNGQGADADGVYEFRRELGGHVLARHAAAGTCKAPDRFDCEHRDLLYVYTEAPGKPLKAIYFDSEGHVLHYNVATPDAKSVEFLSEPAADAPRFRLRYTLQGATLSGSFAVQPPGSAVWRPYLEWSGTRR